MNLHGVTAVVMAKLPEPGRVKTRLVSGRLLDAVAAAELAWMMLECTVRRLVETESGALGAALQAMWAVRRQSEPVLSIGAVIADNNTMQKTAMAAITARRQRSSTPCDDTNAVRSPAPIPPKKLVPSTANSTAGWDPVPPIA